MNRIILLLFILFNIKGYSQREIVATKKVQSIDLDGILNETEWQNAQWSSGFTQMRPFPGKKPSQKTQVAILYDKEAVYFGIKCFDHPDSISKVLSIRDDFNPNLDVFAIFIDTYQDQQNGFMFAFTSRGVQLDSKFLTLNLITYLT